MEVNQKGEVVDHEIVPAIINSTERMTYTCLLYTSIILLVLYGKDPCIG